MKASKRSSAPHRWACFWLVTTSWAALACPPSASQLPEVPDVALFFEAASPNRASAESALKTIGDNWRDSYASMLLDVTRFVSERSPRGSRIIEFLEERTGERFGTDIDAWLRWSWRLPYEPHHDYALFKAALFTQIDEGMAQFFTYSHKANIRLDEVQWGGVRVNGIPPLDHPTAIEAAAATYLADSDVVFGIALNGEARAYPKRILGWHEMALDQVGGVELTIIYCTLCGTVLPYESEVNGQLFRFGTSGLLYRSNKLFFDEGTRSLWSTLEGRPVIGNLTDQDLELRLRSSVTTTWGDWKRRHPDTTVLAIETGYDRDYSEGAAYRDYFSNDELMFEVPETDDRLRNKDEVLVLFIESGEGDRVPVAISIETLNDYAVFPVEIGDTSLVVITSDGGANRVYDAEGSSFVLRTESATIVDAEGGEWELSEDALIKVGGSRQARPRVTANRAFWFGWYAQFPHTLLFDRPAN